jgi:hypothetical protein
VLWKIKIEDADSAAFSTTALCESDLSHSSRFPQKIASIRVVKQLLFKVREVFVQEAKPNPIGPEALQGDE